MHALPQVRNCCPRHRQTQERRSEPSRAVSAWSACSSASPGSASLAISARPYPPDTGSHLIHHHTSAPCLKDRLFLHVLLSISSARSTERDPMTPPLTQKLSPYIATCQSKGVSLGSQTALTGGLHAQHKMNSRAFLEALCPTVLSQDAVFVCFLAHSISAYILWDSWVCGGMCVLRVDFVVLFAPFPVSLFWKTERARIQIGGETGRNREE